ncbi:MAG: protein-L-isoaspartate(D-aspartate) O-methyltransferase [Myxococcales bacterium]|nr:MAG: protein-L-isoaspartate(D-aspartate) O-methyltransferase [Myxococcales bacterium]
MVRDQLVARRITDPRVLAAMGAVPREPFVPGDLRGFAYADRPLPIEHEQTISQPYIVAVTLQALGLTGGERVLEVGTGSGYVAALLTRLAREVYTIERLEPLAATARERLDALGYPVAVGHGDGTLGWPEHAPFDAIAVAAGGPRVPPALVAQLAPGGRMVIPVREGDRQWLVRVVKTPDGLRTEPLEEVRFVPLIGAQGEPE